MVAIQQPMKDIQMQKDSLSKQVFLKQEELNCLKSKQEDFHKQISNLNETNQSVDEEIQDLNKLLVDLDKQNNKKKLDKDKKMNQIRALFKKKVQKV